MPGGSEHTVQVLINNIHEVLRVPHDCLVDGEANFDFLAVREDTNVAAHRSVRYSHETQRLDATVGDSGCWRDGPIDKAVGKSKSFREIIEDPLSQQEREPHDYAVHVYHGKRSHGPVHFAQIV